MPTQLLNVLPGTCELRCHGAGRSGTENSAARTIAGGACCPLSLQASFAGIFCVPGMLLFRECCYRVRDSKASGRFKWMRLQSAALPHWQTCADTLPRQCSEQKQKFNKLGSPKPAIKLSEPPSTSSPEKGMAS